MPKLCKSLCSSIISNPEMIQQVACVYRIQSVGTFLHKNMTKKQLAGGGPSLLSISQCTDVCAVSHQ